MRCLLISIVAFVIASISPQAMSMYRCTAANGSVSFQDKPCDGQGVVINPTPASGSAPAKQNQNTSSSVQVSSYQAQKNLADRLRRERLVRDGNWEAASLNTELARLSRDCAKVQKQHTDTLTSEVNTPSARANKNYALEQLASNDRACNERRSAIYKQFNKLE
jgi:Domain of unknown function (DUF4124)